MTTTTTRVSNASVMLVQRENEGHVLGPTVVALHVERDSDDLPGADEHRHRHRGARARPSPDPSEHERPPQSWCGGRSLAAAEFGSPQMPPGPYPNSVGAAGATGMAQSGG